MKYFVIPSERSKSRNLKKRSLHASRFRWDLVGMTAGVVFLLLTFAPKVSAQQVSLGISPPLLEVLIKPGKSIMVAYNLENSGDPVHINVKMASFETKDNFGENSPQIFASASFFAFPFKLLFGLIIVIVGTIYIIKRFFSDQ